MQLFSVVEFSTNPRRTELKYCIAKETINKTKQKQPNEWEKMFAVEGNVCCNRKLCLV